MAAETIPSAQYRPHFEIIVVDSENEPLKVQTIA
jgi:hypothetical protein